jgi:hypothetical protein
LGEITIASLNIDVVAFVIDAFDESFSYVNITNTTKIVISFSNVRTYT